ncbi:MAG: hypothetical protein JW753_09800 [Dehalococcoidia bacterium]|nr:hypothetical protein [Dehalococcoidia bacterium]
MRRDVPAIVQQQYEAAMRTPNLDREEAERRFPQLLEWLLQHVNLADVVRDSGVSLKPVSPDAPGVFSGDCPFCAVST